MEFSEDDHQSNSLVEETVPRVLAFCSALRSAHQRGAVRKASRLLTFDGMDGRLRADSRWDG